MKRIFAVFLCVILLSGCASSQSIDSAISLRQSLLSTNGCSFQAKITADYGTAVYQFELSCTFDKIGDMTFSVIAPDSISGITGRISDSNGQLTFDDHVLGFALLADDQFSPVSAPWILMKTLRGGYIHCASKTKGGTYICIDDSYGDNALQLDIWLDGEKLPVEAEILWKNRRILSIQIADFTFL